MRQKNNHYIFFLLVCYLALTSGCSLHTHPPHNEQIPTMKEDYIGQAEKHFSMGISLISSGQRDKKSLLTAAEEFAIAIRLFPEFQEAHLNLGLTYSYLNERELAIKRFTILRDRFSGPLHDKATYNLGVSYIRNNQPDSALKLFHDLKNRNNSKATLNMGIIYLNKGAYDRAESELTTAIKQTPENPTGYFYRGLLFMKKGSSFFAQAKKDFLAVLSLKKDYVYAHFHLGVIYYHEQNTTKALTMFLQASKLKPDWKEIYYNLGIIYDDRGDKNNAITAFILAAKLDHTPSMIALAKMYMEQEKKDLAIQAIQGILAMDKTNIQAYFSLGVIHQKTGDINKAIELYNQTLSRDSGHTMALNNLAISYREAGQLDRSLETYTTLIGIAPTFRLAHKNAGIVYDIYLNDLEKAEFHYREYLKNNNTTTDTVEDWLGEITRRREQKS